MSENDLPEKLLIFKPINKYCFDVILGNKLVATDPIRGFNDPFDCYCDFSFEGWTKEDILSKLRGKFILNKGYPSKKLSSQDHLDIQIEKDRLNSLSEDILKKYLSNQFTEIMRNDFSESLRIRCFSALNHKRTLNNVLFSHYSDEHKGLCYIFDTQIILSSHNNESLIEVNYSEKTRQVPINKSFQYSEEEFHKNSEEEFFQIGLDMLSCKHIDWSYENEWRHLIQVESSPKIYETFNFEPNSLEGIVLGINVNEEDEKRIIELVKRRTSEVKVFKASRIFGSFELEYENNPIYS